MTPPETALPEPQEPSCRRAMLRLASVATADGDAEPDGLVDGLVEAVEQLDRATEDGWRLVGVKLLRDAAGDYQLDARLARPAPLSGTPLRDIPADEAKAA